MATILGLDLSLTGSGYVVLQNGELKEHGRIEPKYVGVDRLIEIEDKILSLITGLLHDGAGLVFVALEDYAFSRPNQAHQIGELGGVIRRMLHIEKIDWISISPSAVKKFATGKGNAKKDLILQQVYKRWGIEFETSDEADAYVLAIIGETYLKWGINDYSGELTAFQQEVIQGIVGGKAAKPKGKGKGRKAG